MLPTHMWRAETPHPPIERSLGTPLSCLAQWQTIRTIPSPRVVSFTLAKKNLFRNCGYIYYMRWLETWIDLYKQIMLAPVGASTMIKVWWLPVNTIYDWLKATWSGFVQPMRLSLSRKMVMGTRETQSQEWIKKVGSSHASNYEQRA